MHFGCRKGRGIIPSQKGDRSDMLRVWKGVGSCVAGGLFASPSGF